MPLPLPDLTSLPQIDPRATGALPAYPTVNPVNTATGELGAGVLKAGETTETYAYLEARKNRNLQDAQAGSQLLIDNDLLNQKIAQTTDLDQIAKLRTGYRDNVARNAELIGDADHSEVWRLKHTGLAIKGEIYADKQAWNLQASQSIASTFTQRHQLVGAFGRAETPEEFGDISGKIGQQISSQLAAGFITPIEAAKQSEAVAGDLVRSRVAALATKSAQYPDGRPELAMQFLQAHQNQIPPDLAESLSRHLKPMVDRAIGVGAAKATRDGPGGPGASGGASGGWGSLAVPAIDTFKAAGASDAFIQGAMANGLGEGRFNQPWQQSEIVGKEGREESFGHWQFHKGGELERYLAAEGKDNPQDTKAQAQFLMRRMEEIQPGITKSTDPRAVTDTIATKFERYKGAAPGQRYGHLAEAQRQMAGGLTPVADLPPETGTFPKGPDDPSPMHYERAGGGWKIVEGAAPPNQVPPPAAPAPTPGVPDVRAWVDRIKANTTLTEEQKDIAIREVQQEQQQTMLGHAQAESDLAMGIARGEKGRADIEDAYRTQRISPEKRTSLNSAIDKIEADQNTLAQGVAKVSAAGNGGAPLDPKSKDDRTFLNFHYDAVSKAWPAGEALDRSIQYSQQYGMVPAALQARIRGGLHSGRPELAIEAAQTVARIRNTNPQLVGEIGDGNDLRLATLISTFSSAGLAPERAMQMAVNGLKVDKLDREARVEDYKTQRGKTAVEQHASDTSWIGNQQNSIWVHDPNVDPMMRHEFEVVAEAEFQKTGNLEASRRMSLDNINRVWGRSRVGGDLRYMKHAPEKFYGVPSLSGDENAAWMNEQLVGDLAVNAVVDAPITKDRVKLLPDPTRVQNGAPLYQVWLERPDKAWTQQVKPNGEPYLWRPDWLTSEGYKRQQEERARSIQNLRERRVAPPVSFLDRILSAPATLQERISRGSGGSP